MFVRKEVIGDMDKNCTFKLLKRNTNKCMLQHRYDNTYSVKSHFMLTNYKLNIISRKVGQIKKHNL